MSFKAVTAERSRSGPRGVSTSALLGKLAPRWAHARQNLRSLAESAGKLDGGRTAVSISYEIQSIAALMDLPLS